MGLKQGKGPSLCAVVIDDQIAVRFVKAGECEADGLTNDCIRVPDSGLPAAVGLELRVGVVARGEHPNGWRKRGKGGHSGGISGGM